MFRIRLKELRENIGISQYKLAEDLKLSQSTIGNWEAGKREPDFSTLIKLADYFNVSADYLIGHTEKRSLIERPKYALSEKFASDFGELLSDSKFIDFAKLFKAMDDAQRMFILARTVGYLNGLGVDTQAIVGY